MGKYMKDLHIDLEQNGCTEYVAYLNNSFIEICRRNLNIFFELVSGPITLVISSKKHRNSYKVKLDMIRGEIHFLDIKEKCEKAYYMYSYTQRNILALRPELATKPFYISVRQ